MKLFLQYLSLFLQFKKNLVLSTVANVLAAIFTVFSIPLLIPFFQILFDRDPADHSIESKSTFERYLNEIFVTYTAGLDKQTALLYICGFIILVFLLKNLFRYLSMYFIVPARNGIIEILRSQLFQTYLQLPISHFKETKRGDMISRLGMDIAEIEWSILNVVQATFKSPIIIIGSILFMLLISVKLTMFVLLLLLVTIVIIGGISRSLKQQSKEGQQRMASLISYVEESFGGMKTIKALRSEKMRFDQFNTQNKAFKDIRDKVLRKRDLSSPLSEFMGIIIVCILLLYGSKLVFNQEMMPETFFAFIFAFYQVIEPSKSFAAAYFNIRKGMASIERVDEYLALGMLPLSAPRSPIPFLDKIEYRDVSFTYPDGNESIISNFNLTIHKGESIAILGPSGVGKTTMVDLLLQFYQPTSGQIYIDGQPIQDRSIAENRSLFGYIEQDTILFHDTIWANITMHQSEQDKSKVVEAAKLANAHGFISKLQNGYQNIVGESGNKLSGGQKQRVALSRIIYQDAPIFLFDEATSALDVESEQLIQSALRKVLANKTAIIIAHKLSTLDMVDRVVTLDRRGIVQDLTKEAYFSSIGDTTF